jgi:hypothetical protein
MSPARFITTVIFLLSTIGMVGCNSGNPRLEALKSSFADMKSATDSFGDLLEKVQDLKSAEELLPELEASHKRLAISVQALDEASGTSSRSTTMLKTEIVEYKFAQKNRLKKEFTRLKKDKELRTYLEPFLKRCNAM